MVVLVCWLLFFGYLYLRRSRCASAGAWAPPASSRSVCSSFLDLDAIAATLHSSVVYCPQDTVCSMAWSCSTRLRVESNIQVGQVTGLASTAPPGLLLPHQNAIAATSDSASVRPVRALEPRERLGLRRNHTVQGRSKKGRTKFEATTDATDAPRARPCSSWPSSFARSRRTRRPRPAAARAGPTRRRAR